MKTMRHITLAAAWMLAVCTVPVCAQTVGDVRTRLLQADVDTLYRNTYQSLMDRIETDGFLQESLTGAYRGMYPRTIGAFALLMIETGHPDLAERSLSYVFETMRRNDMERVPHVIDRGYTVLSDQCQIDGQAHIILGWARLARMRSHTAWEDETWPLVSKLMCRTVDRTFFQYGGWGIAPGLIRNIAFEHSRDFRRWDCFDLLTQSFVGAALSEMMALARQHGEEDLAAEWQQCLQRLSEGIRANLVRERDGRPVFLEMLIPTGNRPRAHEGMGWVTLSPVAAGWTVDSVILRNTVEYMESHVMQTTHGIKWMPTDWWSDGSFVDEVIGKGIGWQLDEARTRQRWPRVMEILDEIAATNRGKSIYMEFAWLEGDGFTRNSRMTHADANRMDNVNWTSRDAGNGEQTVWWCWAMARLRRVVGLPAEPGK